MSGNPISRRVVPVVSGGIPLTSIRALHLLPLFRSGKVAQLVEQRTENPCVPGSIPGLATTFVSGAETKVPAVALAKAGMTLSIGVHPYALRLPDRKRVRSQPTLRWPDGRSQLQKLKSNLAKRTRSIL